jgi:selenocysteine-specific elongation factor
MIIAVAGHVDHGKTSLIRLLTGIDPDRLPDEKRRGMTIDLGFAHVRLPDGGQVGFVDVPGHERFLTNMLAGVLSVDTALLVIAADDGPMPQTEEHLAILRLVNVTDLSVVVTKIDRVGPDELALGMGRITALLARAGYPDAPMMGLSNVTGQGIDDLRAFLARKVAAWRPRPALGGFRLAVDRAFVLDGTGVVVTGTVAAGSVSVGDRLLLSPTRLAARVRSIQRHHEAATTARAGDRCALALSGPQIERGRIHRGDWLVAPHLHLPTQRIDVRVRVLEGHVLRQAGLVHVHLGATSTMGRALVLDSQDVPAEREAFVNLRLQRPVATLFGDRVILRDDGTGRVIAGGAVVDPFSPDRRVRRGLRETTLAALGRTDPREVMAELLAAEGWLDVGRLALARNLDPVTLLAAGASLPARLIGSEAEPVLLADATGQEIRERLRLRLEKWHAEHPDLPGPTKAALLAAIPAVPADLAEAVLRDMVAAREVVSHGRSLALPEHRPTLATEDRLVWQRVEPALLASGLRPPRVRELAEELNLDPAVTDRHLARLERFGLLIRVAPNRFFLPQTVVALGGVAEGLAEEGEAAGFSAGAFSQRSGIGRNLTIQVLEFLDRIGVTQRVGEYRFVRRSVTSTLY